MTAPDDLARTRDAIAAVRAELHSPIGQHRLANVAGELADAAAHLASVVSRRDTDLRTRIGKLRDEIDEGRYLDLAEIVTELSRALDGDTREDCEKVCGPVCRNLGCAADSRVPADTDTGRGQ